MLLIVREHANFREHPGMRDRAFDVLCEQAAINAHTLCEFLYPAIGRHIEYATPRLFRQFEPRLLIQDAMNNRQRTKSK